MNTQIIVQVTTEVAGALRQSTVAPDSARIIQDLVRRHHALLVPLFPDARDPLGATFFVAEFPDEKTAASVITHLRQSSTVTAAYIKPPDELP